ncbi:MAG: restriction endonuclease subunit S [Peptoniphilus sp.]|uniref:restriction endonuclease subunit S n=1 Tax=Peptoniphilus sp. TaxID=1971214 RepID=UPI003999AF49
MVWKNSTLSEISRIGDGAHASLKRVDSGIPYLTAKNVTKSGVDYSNIDYISEETYNKHFKEKSNALTQPKTDDILYSIIGSIGGVYVVRDEKIGISSSVAIFRADREKVLPHYLAYFLKSSSFDAQVQAIKGGVAQGFMSIGKLGTVNITYPEDIEYQKRIVDVLYAYDNLIENNQKQIKLLEEAAQRLYKEWFVDLHFPGYEDVEIVDGVPEGWENVPLRNMISFDIGGGWGEENIKEKSENPAYVIRGKDIYGITHGDMYSIPFRYHTESNLSSRILQEGDIVFEVSGGSKTEGVARTLLITKEMLESYGSPVICASFCKLVRINELPYSQYMYDTFQFLRSSGKTTEFDKKSASSIVNYRWKDFLAQQNILVPPHSILDTYNCIAESLYHQKINHSKQIESLKNARDRLLPKLMSGEIEV